MKRILLPLAVAAGLLGAPALAQARTLQVGVSDQNAFTFWNPNFFPLHMTTARLIVPYDVMLRKGDLRAARKWISAARNAGQEMLVSFEHSYKHGRERHVPSAKEYRADVTRFRKAFPDVRDISPWNEVDRCPARAGRTWVGQPICHNPRAAATYYKVARSVFKGDKIVALDVLDQNKVSAAVSYIRAFRHYARPPRSAIWGLHDYSDTNRFSSSRTRAMIRATRAGQIWLTETGGLVRFGRSFPYNQNRAKKALGCMFTIAKSQRRITRLYIYNFWGTRRKSRFDAGLLNVNGTRRPGWYVVQRRQSMRCHK